MDSVNFYTISPPLLALYSSLLHLSIVLSLSVYVYFTSSSSSWQNGQKQTDPGSLEDLSRDETDRAVPLSEPITIQRRSPLIRNHKTGSMEVMNTDASPPPPPTLISVRFASEHQLGYAPVCLQGAF